MDVYIDYPKSYDYIQEYIIKFDSLGIIKNPDLYWEHVLNVWSNVDE